MMSDSSEGGRQGAGPRLVVLIGVIAMLPTTWGEG